MKYLIGQRVILNDQEVGTVTNPPDYGKQTSDSVWVYSPIRKYDICVAEHNVKPLPGGQL